MATLNELLQDYVNLSYDQLIAIAKDEFAKFAYGISNAFGDDDETASRALLVFVAAALGADNRLTDLENKFLNDLLEADHSYEETCEMVAALGGNESREVIDNLIDSLPTDVKAAGLTVALCFCAVDENITREEVSYFVKLME
jgi:hypothetical protein